MKRKVKRSLPEHYSHISYTPIFNWNMVFETSDLTWLLVKRKNVPKIIVKRLEEVWSNLTNQYIHEFGFSDHFLALKRKEIEIAELQCELILTGDRINETWIEIAQNELIDLRTDVSKGDIERTKMAIEKKQGYQLNMKETTVREFYKYLKHLN